MNAQESTSTRPYLIRALYEWCTDNGLTPYVAVRVDDSVQVPREFVKDGEIVLNISFDATSALQLVADAVDRREPLQLAERFLGEADMVLAEGFSHAPGPKIEILRRACGKPPRCALEDGLIAIVTDCPEIYPELPHFALDDLAGLADFLLRHPR